MQPTDPAIFTGVELITLICATLVTAIFLTLSLRAGSAVVAPRANVILALCAFMWSLGGITSSLLEVFGASPEDRWLLLAQAMKMAGAIIWIVPMMAIWRPYVQRPWERIGLRLLQGVALLAALFYLVTYLAGAWGGWFPVPLAQLKESFRFVMAASGAGMLVISGSIRKTESLPRVIRVSFGLVLAGILILTLGLGLRAVCPSGGVTDTLSLLIALAPLVILCGALFLYSKFRFADCFIHQSLFIVMTAIVASVIAVFSQAKGGVWLWTDPDGPEAVRILFAGLAVTILSAGTIALGRILNRLVDRHIFPPPDYGLVIDQLRERLAALRDEEEIGQAVTATAREVLDLEDVRVVTVSEGLAVSLPRRCPRGFVELAPGDPLHGLLPTAGVELLVPVPDRGELTQVLAIAPGRKRRGLVTHEIGFLREVATRISSRRESLRHERALLEKHHREEFLLRQVVESELRALRAQVNPHFLFNSLNTLADLIVTDTARAETMTLRLAQVFRHVLAHSTRPLVSVQEEMDFLRRYLYIEEARFGERLRVSFEIDPETVTRAIPSLILQPLVENSLKHGLGPKLGAGHLRIAASKDAGHIRLTVEDDGVGNAADAVRDPVVAAPRRPDSPGVGLANVRRRLEALYGGRASFALEALAPAGCRATLMIPFTDEALPATA
ncbi:histidine kinase [Opitutaceae bacterium TAV5]|nr:histidine kinase [Opitutaceae bacterium TAV5]